MVAEKIAVDLLEYLKRNGDCSARVHSVFNEAFNIIDSHGELIACLAHDKDIEPMSLLLDMSSRELLAIAQEDPVRLSGDALVFTKTNRRIPLDKAMHWDPSANFEGTLSTAMEQCKRVDVLGRLLIEEGSEAGIAPLIRQFAFDTGQVEFSRPDAPANAYCRFIDERLALLLQAVAEGSYAEAIRLIPSVIGFGPGLTPSTDDFITGLMITLYYEAAITQDDATDIRDFLTQISLVCQGRTTAVSETMIRQVALGKVSESYRRLIRGIFFEVASPFEASIRNVLKHGASSGADFLLGVYCMNRIRLNKGKGDNVQ